MSYYDTTESVEEYIKLAKGFDGKNLIDTLSLFLPNTSEVLELGSGPGSDWKILNELYKTTGSDNSTEFLNHLIIKYPSGNFLNLDAVELKTIKTFDGIYSNKVLHHLTDKQLKKSVQRQSEILKPDGIICHSFWKGEGNEMFKGLFVNYHDKAKLKKFFQENFHLLRIEEYKEFEENDSILLIGKRK